MNCILVDDDPFSRKVLSDLVAQTEILHLVTACSTAMEAINVLNTEQVDLMLLDIEMPEISGFDLLSNLESKPLVILITGHEQFAARAFEYNVTDYLVKPIEFARFSKAINRAHDLYKQALTVPSTHASFYIKVSGSLVKLNQSDILWIEALENYMTINTINEKYTVHFTMKSLEDKLPSQEFLRVHRSYIVRKDKIDSISDDEIRIGKDRIPVGRTYKKELNKNINLL
ncbi:MAG: response regulator transcription factor [Flavobacteriales bacterium]|nr:response regulator transcription factor [Flavobacteriales bacterium]